MYLIGLRKVRDYRNLSDKNIPEFFRKLSQKETLETLRRKRNQSCHKKVGYYHSCYYYCSVVIYGHVRKKGCFYLPHSTRANYSQSPVKENNFTMTKLLSEMHLDRQNENWYEVMLKIPTVPKVWPENDTRNLMSLGLK